MVPRFLPLSVLLSLSITLASFSVSNGQTSDAATEIDLKKLWNEVLEVNSAWLAPQPPPLHYKLTGSRIDRDARAEFTKHVWIDGERWRLEVESKLALPPDGLEETAKLTFVSDGHEMVCHEAIYLGEPRKSRLGVRKPATDIHRFRQGLIWFTAMHATQRHGLPKDCQVARIDTIGETQIVVLEMSFPEEPRMDVGLGLRNMILGQIQRPFGRVRIHLSMPERRPVLEEHLAEDTDEVEIRIEYAPDYLKLGEQCAPSMIRMVHGPIFKAKRWVLEATFQNADGMWLLDKAVNKLDDKTATRIQLSDISTDAVDPSLFKMQMETPDTDADSKD